MEIVPIISNSYSSNSYILKGGGKVLIIDSGMALGPISEKIKEVDREENTILLTHCHYDHTAITNELREKLGGANVIAHPLCAEILEGENDDFMRAKTFGEENFHIKIDETIEEGDIVALDEKTALEVIFTPGHTQGSICLYEPDTKSLFSGDTVFSEGIGRYDLPTGDLEELKASLRKLMKLHEDRGIDKLYSGHGPIGAGGNIKNIYSMYFGGI